MLYFQTTEKTKQFFRNIRRWPGDGLEKKQQEFLNGKDRHHESSNPCEIQMELTRLLGGWPVEIRFADMNQDCKSMFISIPRQIQVEAAFELLNVEQAIDNLFAVCERGDAKKLLKGVGAYGAVKYGKRSFVSWTSGEVPVTTSGMKGARIDDAGYMDLSPQCNHGINLIIAKLVIHDADSDENLRLLFGSEMFVLGPLLEIQFVISTDAPVDSPMGNKRIELLDESKLQPLKTCAHCLQITHTQTSICAGCKREVFCSKDCLRAGWPLHRIECFRVQGKEITPKILAAAQTAQEVKARQAETGKREHVAEIKKSIQHDMTAVGFLQLFDCDNQPRLQYLSYYYLDALQIIASEFSGATFENEILLIVKPPGNFVEGARQVVFKHRGTGALIVVGFTKLFFLNGDGPFGGITVDDIYVAKSSTKVMGAKGEGGEVEWTSVPRPEVSQATNGWTHLSQWFLLAKDRAIHPTKDIFYHLGSIGSMRERSGYYGP